MDFTAFIFDSMIPLLLLYLHDVCLPLSNLDKDDDEEKGETRVSTVPLIQHAFHDDEMTVPF